MDESLTLISTILTILASIYAIYAYYPSKVKNTMDILEKNSETRKHQIELLNIEKGFYKNYKNILKKILNFLDSIFDKPYENNSKTFKFFSNLSIHYTLSLLYTFIVFIFFWLFGGSGEIGFIKILPDTNTTSLFSKISIIFFIFSISFIFYFLIKDDLNYLYKEIENFLIKKIKKLYPNKAFLIYRIFSVFIVATFFYAFNFNLFFILLASLFSYFFSILSLFFILLVEVGGGVVGVVVGAGVGIINLLNNGIFWNSLNISVILFFLILPLINSILDYLSLKVSRYFAKKIYNDTSWYVLFHILADIFLAIFFLVSLYLLIFYSFSYINIFVDNKELYIDIAEILQKVWQNPFDVEYAWVSFMLFSTLIPTLVHLIIAILGIFVAIYPKHKIKENIEKYEERPSLIYLENASKMIAKRNIIITLFSFATLILIFYFANEYWSTINSSNSSAPFIQNLI